MFHCRKYRISKSNDYNNIENDKNEDISLLQVDHMKPVLYNRDLSWLSFNERILKEAGKKHVPLLERVNFLAIFSSNLDEFYRVRMPVLSALKKIEKEESNAYKIAQSSIEKQLSLFGDILVGDIIPEWKAGGIHLVYNEKIPDVIATHTRDYFYERIAAFLEITMLTDESFFPQNNQLYLVFTTQEEEIETLGIINIPSDHIPRFYKVSVEDKTYIVFIDDIIRQNLAAILPDKFITGVYAVKVTRDAELDLDNEFEGSLAEKIERKIKKRDFGLATRFLYQPDLRPDLLQKINTCFNLRKSNGMKGGNYHNLKDFFTIPVDRKEWKYTAQPPIPYHLKAESSSLFDEIDTEDILISTPYQSYNIILRFFNEAALNQDVDEIYISMYRVASDSKILQALISAVKNGKKATVFVELKARFDEENNIYWAKKLKAAGVKVLYSIPNLKVHAKIALVTTKKNGVKKHFGLLSTGNLNEKTARVYADHMLLTSNQEILYELKEVFNVLANGRSEETFSPPAFKHLLVAQFNLAERFMQLIDREIAYAKSGNPASMIIKINNLEEKRIIQKLYEASQAGVTIQLIVRSICRLIPGIAGVSENISIRRIVDRYLEHSRVFIFNNNGDEEVYLGSADWMTRNLFHRIEVCFPVVNERLKREIQDIITIQLEDDTSAELLNEHMEAVEIPNEKGIRAQESIYAYCKRKEESSS